MRIREKKIGTLSTEIGPTATKIVKFWPKKAYGIYMCAPTKSNQGEIIRDGDLQTCKPCLGKVLLLLLEWLQVLFSKYMHDSLLGRL